MLTLTLIFFHCKWSGTVSDGRVSWWRWKNEEVHGGRLILLLLDNPTNNNINIFNIFYLKKYLKHIFLFFKNYF